LSVAGPTPANLEQATVTVRRGMQSATMRLADLFERPADDIPLQAGDMVVVRNVVQTVNVLGSAGLQGRIRVTRRNFTVMDAVAEARGLDKRRRRCDRRASKAWLARSRSLPTNCWPKCLRRSLRCPEQTLLSGAGYTMRCR